MISFVVSLMLANIFCAGALPLRESNGALNNMKGENILDVNSINALSTTWDVDEFKSIISRSVRQKLKSIVLGNENTDNDSSDKPTEDDQRVLDSYKEKPRLQGSRSELTKEDVINFIHQQPDYAVDCSADLGELGIMGVWSFERGSRLVTEAVLESAVDKITDSEGFINRYRVPILFMLFDDDASERDKARYAKSWCVFWIPPQSDPEKTFEHGSPGC